MATLLPIRYLVWVLMPAILWLGQPGLLCRCADGSIKFRCSKVGDQVAHKRACCQHSVLSTQSSVLSTRDSGSTCCTVGTRHCCSSLSSPAVAVSKSDDGHRPELATSFACVEPPATLLSALSDASRLIQGDSPPPRDLVISLRALRI